ncbi:MAG: palindromic element RPE5 domain-containing protein [Rickettsia endosymbiont of Pentastiridius leporinus]
MSRGAERTIVREHPRSYKDEVANFSNSASIQHRTYFPYYIIFENSVN